MVERVVATIMRPEGDTGVQTHFRTFIHWLEQRGTSVSLVTPYSAPKALVYPLFAARKVIDPLSKPASVWWYRHWHQRMLEIALRRELARRDACVVYAQCPLSAAAALKVRRSLRQRVVLVVHFNVSQADEWAGKGMLMTSSDYANRIRAFEADTLAKLDGLVFVSDFMRRELMLRMPTIAKVPFVVAPNFVPDPGQPESQQIEADLLIVGTLEPRKNQAYALEIVAAAARQGRRLTLSVAGDGPDRNALEAQAQALGIAGQVRFLGFVRNAAVLFSRHRACLHTARIENLPLTLIEAFSRGVPVFAPAVGGVPEVLNDGQEGRIIPLDHPDQAAALVLQWFELGEQHLAAAGKEARTTFLRRFESDVAAARLDDFLMLVAAA